MTNFWQNKRVLVTGGSGFLGSHLVPVLEQRGASVFVPRSADYDLRDWEAGAQMLCDAGPTDVVFHLAATVGGIGANQARPDDFYYDNVLMNAHMVRHAVTYAVGKLVCLGSVCAYPKWTPPPFVEANLWAGYPEETNAPYGVAKRALLVHLQAAREQYGLRGIYLLPTNLYGPGDSFDPETSHVVPALVRKFVEAKEQDAPQVTVWGTGNASRDFLYVADCVQALLLAAERYDSPEPVNLGSGTETTIAGLAAMIGDIVEYGGQIVYDRSKPDGQPRRSLNSWRALAFGWEASTPLADGLRRTIKWYRSNLGKAVVALKAMEKIIESEGA